MNPRTRKTADGTTMNESRTALQRPTKEPQGKDHDPPPRSVIGLDLSDRTAHYAVIGPVGEDWRAEKKIQLNRESLRRHLAEYAGSLLVMEVGAHSRWVQPVIEELDSRSLWPMPLQSRASLDRRISTTVPMHASLRGWDVPIAACCAGLITAVMQHNPICC